MRHVNKQRVDYHMVEMTSTEITFLVRVLAKYHGDRSLPDEEVKQAKSMLDQFDKILCGP